MKNRLSYITFRIFAFVIGILPFRLLYVLSNIFAFVIGSIIGYRKKIIKSNLRKSFPKFSADKIEKLTSEYYLYLSDLILEGIKSYQMSPTALLDKRLKFTNVEYVDQLMENNDGVIVMASHYNNWEWVVSIINVAMNQRCIGFYMPLSHPLIDKYMYKKRTKNGSIAYPGQQSLRVINKEKANKPVFFMIADQSPSNLNKVAWIDFLNQETAFLVGAEKIATKYNYPLLYIDIQQTRRGHYEITYELLTENPKSCTPGEITKLYAKHLEQKIITNPVPWLWSHRRWKHTRTK